MTVSPNAESVPATPVPTASRTLATVINPLYRFFDWLYGSGYNPLYRSGTLAVGFLFILLGSGLYLSFFYSVSDPYQSLSDLQNQIWLGRWVRALHRYTTVATVFAIAFHVLQLLVQGKNWGPRVLAWISGVLLLLMFFVSVWSGYVMVWDLHGQRFALAGTQMLATFPILRDVATAAFDGTAAIPAGFFFMNLFLHVALPVMMIMFLWIHTARLSRAVWFPTRPIMIWSTVGLIVLSILWPAPLLERANLLRVVGRIPTDLSAGFWISWIDYLGATSTWIFLALAVGMLFILPWIWRPRRDTLRGISQVDLAACTGCTQCARDCPYEAIRMVPRPDGKRLVAEITANHCVSCGICAASCADFAIGPPHRTAVDQRDRVSRFCSTIRGQNAQLDMVLIACSNNSGLSEVLNAQVAETPSAAIYQVECCGCMHTEVIEQILEVSKGIALIGCPARNCFNRDGGELLTQRIFEKRVPFLDRSIDRNRLLITTFSESESDSVERALAGFHSRLNGSAAALDTRFAWYQRLRALVTSGVLLILCATVAQVPMGTDAPNAILRVAGLLPSYADAQCRTPQEDELTGIPLHMRPKQICDRTPISYNLEVFLDSNLILERAIANGDRLDQPISLDVEHAIVPGNHSLEIRLSASTPASTPITCTANATLVAGQILLAHFDRESSKLLCS